MDSILDQDAVTIETDGYDRHTVGWADDYELDRIKVDRNGILYVGEAAGALAVGVVIAAAGWNRLAETRGGSLLGNVRNTGWFPCDSREEWEADCAEPAPR